MRKPLDLPIGVPRHPKDEVVKGTVLMMGNRKMEGLERLPVVTIPYWGRISLAHLSYMDLVEGIRRYNGDEYYDIDVVGNIWETVILNLFWFEDEVTKERKIEDVRPVLVSTHF